MATAAELDELKAGWVADPVWDIADTTGFEAHRAELAAFQAASEATWRAAEQARQERKAAELGIPGNIALARYILALEARIDALHEQVDRLRADGAR